MSTPLKLAPVQKFTPDSPEFSFFWPWVQQVIEVGQESWKYRPFGKQGSDTGAMDYVRDYIIYRVTNTWTGSIEIKKVYLNDVTT